VVDSANVSIVGTNLTQSVAGLSQAERVEAREKRPSKAGGDAPRKDEFDSAAVQTETAEAVRSLAGNDQEQAREDRQEHPQDPAPAKPRLDVQG
jgi:hypothetical protein